MFNFNGNGPRSSQLVDFTLTRRQAYFLFMLLIIAVISPEFLGVAVAAATSKRSGKSKHAVTPGQLGSDKIVNAEVSAYPSQYSSSAVKRSVKYSKKDVLANKHSTDNIDVINLFNKAFKINCEYTPGTVLGSEKEYYNFCSKIFAKIAERLPFSFSPLVFKKILQDNKNKFSINLVSPVSMEGSCGYANNDRVIGVRLLPESTDKSIASCLSNEFFHLFINELNCPTKTQHINCGLVPNHKKINKKISDGDKMVAEYKKSFDEYEKKPTTTLFETLKPFIEGLECYEPYKLFTAKVDKTIHHAVLQKPGVKILSDDRLFIPAGLAPFDDEFMKTQPLFIRFKKDLSGNFDYKIFFYENENSWQARAKAFFIDREERIKETSSGGLYDVKAKKERDINSRAAYLVKERVSDLADLTPDLLHLFYPGYCQEMSVIFGLEEESYCDRPVYCPGY